MLVVCILYLYIIFFNFVFIIVFCYFCFFFFFKKKKKKKRGGGGGGKRGGGGGGGGGRGGGCQSSLSSKLESPAGVLNWTIKLTLATVAIANLNFAVEIISGTGVVFNVKAS